MVCRLGRVGQREHEPGPTFGPSRTEVRSMHVRVHVHTLHMCACVY